MIDPVDKEEEESPALPRPWIGGWCDAWVMAFVAMFATGSFDHQYRHEVLVQIASKLRNYTEGVARRKRRKCVN